MPTVSFRCTETQKIELEERSQGDISEYVRRQLFRQMEQEDTLEMILQRLDQRPGGDGQPTAGIDRQSMAILIELLLNIHVNQNGLSPANIVQSGQALVAGQSVTGSTGAGQVTVSAANGGLQMAILANNNQGNSLQQIGAGNVLQGTVLQGNSNFVSNMTQLNVVLGNNGLNNLGQNLNLNQLKGLRPNGY